jgi:hypothetical protein
LVSIAREQMVRRNRSEERPWLENQMYKRPWLEETVVGEETP